MPISTTGFLVAALLLTAAAGASGADDAITREAAVCAQDAFRQYSSAMVDWQRKTADLTRVAKPEFSEVARFKARAESLVQWSDWWRVKFLVINDRSRLHIDADNARLAGFDWQLRDEDLLRAAEPEYLSLAQQTESAEELSAQHTLRAALDEYVGLELANSQPWLDALAVRAKRIAEADTALVKCNTQMLLKQTPLRPGRPAARIE